MRNVRVGDVVRNYFLLRIELFIPLSRRSWVFMKWVFSNIISSPSKKSVEFAISKRDFFQEKVFLSEVYGAYGETLK
ncbi:hypothetical protein LEP1GSC137_1239 [Leptospira borgpetersenii str. Noumea 25]|nr:hypothetical protein LEP1GSC137_1239 [Leptospira borgpetersenii str. Noumea 25]